MGHNQGHLALRWMSSLVDLRYGMTDFRDMLVRRRDSATMLWYAIMFGGDNDPNLSGIGLSVQAHEIGYNSPHVSNEDAGLYTSFEVAIIHDVDHKTGKMTDHIMALRGYQSVAEVQQLFDSLNDMFGLSASQPGDTPLSTNEQLGITDPEAGEGY
jgi:hypothetical protein